MMLDLDIHYGVQWLEKEETWTKEQVQAYDNGAEPRNEIMVSRVTTPCYS